MPATSTSTPRYGRRSSASSLDFAYWVLTNVESYLQKNQTSLVFTGTYGEESIQVVVDSAAMVGIALPNDFEVLLRHARQYQADIAPLVAMHTRGALLHKDQGLAVSVGDDKRIVEVADGTITCRYLNQSERDNNFWDGAFLVPGMVYL